MLQLATLIARQVRYRGPYPALMFDGETHDCARLAERMHRTADALAATAGCIRPTWATSTNRAACTSSTAART